jgi:hypothetical protein
VVLLRTLVALTVPTGTYAALAVQLAGSYRAVLDGFPDQPIGSVDEHHPSANSLVIDKPIGRVGNSGHSSASHLHIQAQTLPIAIGDIRATDLPQMLRTPRTHPLLFRDAGLVRGGAEIRSNAIDPRRGDIVRPNG